MKNFLVPVIYLQIGIGNDVLTNLIDFINYDVEKLSRVEELSFHTVIGKVYKTYKYGIT